MERSLPNLALMNSVRGGTGSAHELVTGAKLDATGGIVRCALPATTYRVIETTSAGAGR